MFHKQMGQYFETHLCIQYSTDKIICRTEYYISDWCEV